MALIDVVKQYFENTKYRHEFDEEKNRWVFTLRIKSSIQSGRIFVTALQHGLRVVTISPLGAMEDKRAVLAELITKINTRRLVGGFCLDYNDGEISFKQFLPVSADVDPDYNVVRRTINLGIDELEEYGDVIAQVLFGGKSPNEALDELEKKREAEKAAKAAAEAAKAAEEEGGAVV